MGEWMAPIVFDIERCFVDGRSGPIELGVTPLDDLARAHPPRIDGRGSDGWGGSPFLDYRNEREAEQFRVYDTGRSGTVTGVAVNVRGANIVQSRLDFPTWPEYELECGPFRIRMHDKAIEHWATLVDALASEAIEPTRPVALSSDARSDLRILNIDWRLRGRHLHLAFEPRLVPNPNDHACQVRFEYCIERVRLFAPGWG
jgi:hypothetical protein